MSVADLDNHENVSGSESDLPQIDNEFEEKGSKAELPGID